MTTNPAGLPATRKEIDMTTQYDDDDTPPLHSIRTERIPHSLWRPAGMETLPPGWVNVRIWSHDERLGCDLYVTDECPGKLHWEATVVETVLQFADPDGNLYSQWGDPYDDNPVVVETNHADPPRTYDEYVDATWKPAYIDGGYLGTCRSEEVSRLLAEHGFADAIPRPAGHVDPEEGDDA